MGYDPKFLKSDNPSFIDKIPDEPTCVESFCNYRPLDCLPIYDVRQMVPMGVTKEVDKKAIRACRSPSLLRKLRRLNEYHPHTCRPVLVSGRGWSRNCLSQLAI